MERNAQRAGSSAPPEKAPEDSRCDSSRHSEFGGKEVEQPGHLGTEGLIFDDPETWKNFLNDSIFCALERHEAGLKRPRAEFFHQTCLATRTMLRMTELQMTMGLKADMERDRAIEELRASQKKLSDAQTLIRTLQSDVSKLSERANKVEEIKTQLERENNALREVAARATREHELEATRREKEVVIAFSTSAVCEEICSIMLADALTEILNNCKGQICLELERRGIDFRWDGIDPIGKDANGIEIASVESDVESDRFYPWRDEILQHVERFLNQRACMARAETPMSKNGSWIDSPTSGRRSDIVGDVELDQDGAE
ncbi:hypothetical protein M569_12211 [Genlisea aurea]|uniref:Uncharacterized protein n=1 Tax=Genlisea aurea TaxID=192259 RepID=S8C711_9LAMI|nr:hypothetical protein M569_12211 [Genlisea aurea]